MQTWLILADADVLTINRITVGFGLAIFGLGVITLVLNEISLVLIIFEIIAFVFDEASFGFEVISWGFASALFGSNDWNCLWKCMSFEGFSIIAKKTL